MPETEVSKPKKLDFFHENVMQIAAGKNHFLALTLDNKVYSWGLNEFGQLGANRTTASWHPVLVDVIKDKTIIYITAKENLSAAINAEGSVFSWGNKVKSKGDASGSIGSMDEYVIDIKEKLEASECINLEIGKDKLYAYNSIYLTQYSKQKRRILLYCKSK